MRKLSKKMKYFFELYELLCPTNIFIQSYKVIQSNNYLYLMA